MKKRLTIALSLAVFIIISLPIALVISSIRNQGLYLMIAILGMVYIAVYVFSGLAKLIIYFIYGAVTAAFLILLPTIYQLPFVFIGTLLFVLNPLANFESHLEMKLSDDDVLPIRISIRGSYWPFFSYRREMKNAYHLPQQRKLVTKRWYLYLRQLTTLFLLFFAIFLFIHEIASIANAIDTLDPIYFLSFYSVIIFFMSTLLMYKKGFTSTFRALIIATFPTLVFMIFISNLDLIIRLIMGAVVVVAGITTSVFELIKYYQRVIYESYEYYDVDMQKEVFANALFEPLVYNDSYIQTGTYKVKITQATFDAYWHEILMYANYFEFIIVAYAIAKNYIEITAHFHFKQTKRPEKFKTYLESKFNMTTDLYLFNDPAKKHFEDMYFHRPDYIIARALYLANLAKELEIKSRVIIQMIAYFNTERDLMGFTMEYPVKRIPQMDEETSITVKIEMPLINSAFVIESKIRELLLMLAAHKGRYVRINIYT